jgi:hypothetical protein
MPKIILYCENLMKVVSVLSVFLLIAGYIDIYTSFSFYHIDVTQYLNASEIIISSFTNIVKAFLIVVFVLAGVLTLTFIIKYIFPYGSNKGIFLMFILFTLFELGYVLYNYFSRDYIVFINSLISAVKILIYLIFLLLYYFSMPRVEFKEVPREEYVPITIFLFISMFVITLTFILLDNYNRFFNSKFGKKGNNVTELVLADRKIVANDTLVLAGKTDGFYFLWNRKQNKTDIIPAGEVKEIIKIGN